MPFLKRSPIVKIASIPLDGSPLRGEKGPKVVLIGLSGVGKSRLFDSVASPGISTCLIPKTTEDYRESLVNVGLNQITLIDLPSIDFLHHHNENDQAIFLYLLWGKYWLPDQPKNQQGIGAPDIFIHVVDATSLSRDLELALKLSLLGRPMIIALNRLDEARKKGFYINADVLSEQLGVPVMPTVAHMGKGVSELFEEVISHVRKGICPVPQAFSQYIHKSLQPLETLIIKTGIADTFHAPRTFLLSQLAENNSYFMSKLAERCVDLDTQISSARKEADHLLPRPLEEEIHADRHHRAAKLYEAITTPRATDSHGGWRYWLDKFFLHPHWGLLGSLFVFAAVLFIVFEMSAFIDSHTAAKLADWAQEWQPTSTLGVIASAILDGLIGLIGIVVPYMLPLVLLLVILEESGVMQRIAFVVDRGFHHIGLHGQVAIPFLMGLGCNVPAISAAAAVGARKERIVSSILITFVPCSARSAILLAVGGKYLGGLGVFAIFILTLLLIGFLGRLLSYGRFLSHRFDDSASGFIQTISPYSLPSVKAVGHKTWQRTRDIITIVMPLLVLGGVVIALLSHFGADHIINALLTPITVWWLGLPSDLGVPILFGVLRKELSLLMIYQALGTYEIGMLLTAVQIFTLLVFLTFYVPCLSTFAVMIKTLGRKEALFSIFVSITSALIMAGIIRFALKLAKVLF